MRANGFCFEYWAKTLRKKKPLNYIIHELLNIWIETFKIPLFW
jgi:hypothetical protein